jgi:rhomboid family protein
MLPLPPATQALLLANVAVYFLGDLLGPGLLGPFALWPVGAGFWPWQLGTYAFLHGSFNHLFFNMLGLWMFGGELEQVWGRKRFIQFYAASVLAAALTQLAVDALLGTNSPVIGASGGLFGLLLAFAMIFPNRIILLFFVIPMKAKYLVILYGLLELYQGAAVMNSGVAHFAHLGGMLGGLLMLRYWRGQAPFGRR